MNKHNGAKKSILEGKHGLSERELIMRERHLINSYFQIPCRATIIQDRLGKVPNTFKNSIYIEYDNFLPLLATYLPNPLHLNADF